MLRFNKKLNRIYTLEDFENLSSHELSDIIGNSNKEDFCLGKKYYTKLSSLNYFTFTIK